MDTMKSKAHAHHLEMCSLRMLEALSIVQKAMEDGANEDELNSARLELKALGKELTTSVSEFLRLEKNKKLN